VLCTRLEPRLGKSNDAEKCGRATAAAEPVVAAREAVVMDSAAGRGERRRARGEGEVGVEPIDTVGDSTSV
jgi:hypothetical protein